MKKIVQLFAFLFLLFAHNTFGQDSESSSRSTRNKKAFMGVVLGTNWGDGVEINSVTDNYGADRAGLRRGDIITAINSDNINNGSDFTKILRKYKPSEVVKVSYTRGKDKMTADVKLAESPNGDWNFDFSDNVNVNIDKDEINDIVEAIKESGEDIRDAVKDNLKMTEKARLGIYPETDWSEKAVKITGFTSKSAAKDAGLKKGDLIIKIDDDETNTEEELRFALKKHQPNDEVKVVYLRDKKTMDTKIKLGAEKVWEGGEKTYYNNGDGWGTSYAKKQENNETRAWSSYTFADGTQVDLNDFRIKSNKDDIDVSFEAKLNQPFSVVLYDDKGKELLREEKTSSDGKFEKKFMVANTASQNYFVKLWINGREAFSQKVEVSGR